MNSYHCFDIVIALFPFEEDPTIKKKRPVLLMSAADQFGRYKAAKITSTRRKWSFFLPQKTAPDTGLDHDSWLDLYRPVELIPESDIIYKIGHFPSSEKENFKKYLCRLLKFKTKKI